MGLISRVSSRTYRKKTNLAIMGRMHAPGKGMSSSALPYVRKAPNWLRLSKDEIVESIIKLSKKGYRPSAIGVQIRDQYGVSQSKYVTGNKILRVLKPPPRSILQDQQGHGPTLEVRQHHRFRSRRISAKSLNDEKFKFKIKMFLINCLMASSLGINK